MTRPDTRTKFEKWLDSLSETNRTTVTAWLEDTSIFDAQIARWIREDDVEDQFVGYRGDSETIATWRRAHGYR
ncbi:hypothetical protein J2Y46_002591 [Microbacterium sp. BE35]|uniref:hypothetical protein n=1 Tax=Microbacterium sp. BE35 TaxID=2817773 RepID=UPI0028677AE2|nr:hypothetical protein [Microbacterium sp. BE35]MDR7189765.1 hypothetical protein [Microbacterium sp. BE35]